MLPPASTVPAGLDPRRNETDEDLIGRERPPDTVQPFDADDHRERRNDGEQQGNDERGAIGHHDDQTTASAEEGSRHGPRDPGLICRSPECTVEGAVIVDSGRPLRGRLKEWKARTVWPACPPPSPRIGSGASFSLISRP